MGYETNDQRPDWGLVQRLWFQGALPWLMVHLCIGRLHIVGAEQVPVVGPVLFVGLHRAGLMDGWVYSHALPRRTVFMVAAARMRQPWMRLLVAGIAVVRRQDGGQPAANRAALANCRRELAVGGTVFVFPEGTSSLAPGHLPFQPGAALLARSCPSATIVPLAIRYAAPTHLGTSVEVLVGTPFHLPSGISPRMAQDRLTEALETADAAVRAPTPARNPLRWLVAVLNAPTVAAMRLAARVLPDGDNVVLVWAAVTGLPVQCLWSLAATGGLLWAGLPWAAACYAGATAVHAAWPLRSYRRA